MGRSFFRKRRSGDDNFDVEGIVWSGSERGAVAWIGKLVRLYAMIIQRSLIITGRSPQSLLEHGISK